VDGRENREVVIGYRSLTTWKVIRSFTALELVEVISRETKDNIRRGSRIAMYVCHLSCEKATPALRLYT